MIKGIVFVQSGTFKDYGGWMLDQQFMDQMGSSYLIAHGLGKPVADANTNVSFPAAGKYKVWARTKDWVAQWKAPGAPGKFQILVDGNPLEAVFGTKGADWHWQEGGSVEIKNKNAKISLHDLTGFDGRCDAIVFSSDAKFAPPEKADELAVFRKKAQDLPDNPEDAGTYDLVVVGGGIAGECAAISGARSGLKVAFVHDHPVLGGNNSSEVRVHLGGKINLPPYPSLGNIVKEIGPLKQGNAQPAETYEDEKKLKVVEKEKNIRLFLNIHATGVEKEGNKITAVIGKDIRSGREIKFKAPLFVDCTGDGCVGFLAGAEFRMGREGRNETGESIAPDKGDKMTMGSSVQWYSEKREKTVSFPECPWAVQFNEDTAQKVEMGEWDWETGMNRHQIDEFEFVRDYGLRVVYGNWSFLKNKYSERAKFADNDLSWVAYVAGKRESRRLLGDVILCQQDIEGAKSFPDACVVTTWTIDLHYPEAKNSKDFPGQEFRSIAKHVKITPYPIPYRTLYSRNIENLFMAGRNISVTHVALGTVRVMRTTGMMGEVIGMAAALCKKNRTSPRGVYEKHLEELKGMMSK
ncbi:MAG TPA: pyridine nucleotide-disulfide oxidoreductase [Lentisphaeria bacterium]|nr:MAG: pyridine nucleotide-disulfide oxidoreductase [Lentisphaerae bacterium GWF2_49_21]HBC86610.1 pyridine nucleotide-disulfide oxidoreductase [Lentisphaeria bacterium]